MQTPTAGAVARAAAAGGGGGASSSRQATSPVLHSSCKHRSSTGSGGRGGAAAAAAGLAGRPASDAEYLQALQQQQQHQQHGGQGLEAVFHSQNPPATPAAPGLNQQGGGGPGLGKQHGSQRSPYPGAAAVGGSNVMNGHTLSSPSPGPWWGPNLDTPLPAAPTPSALLPLPTPSSSKETGGAAGGAGAGGGGSGGSQAAGGGAAAAVAAAAAASGVNPLLTNLPSSNKWASGKGGASALQRRLSGGAESIPHRLTSIAEV